MKTKKEKNMKRKWMLGSLLLLGASSSFAQNTTPLVQFTDEALKPEFSMKIDDQDLNQMKEALKKSINGFDQMEPLKISINDLYKAGDEKSIYAATQAVGEEFTLVAKKLAEMTARVYRLSAIIQTTSDVTDLYDAYQKSFQYSYDSMINSLVNPNPKIIAAMKTCVSDMCATQLRDAMNDLVAFGVAINKGIKLQKLDRFNFSFEFKSSLIRASLSETFTELNRPNEKNAAYRTLLAAILSPFVVAEKGVMKTGDNLARLVSASKTVQLKLFASPVNVNEDEQLEMIRQSYRETLGLVDANYKAYQGEGGRESSDAAHTARFFGFIGKTLITRISAVGIETQVRNMQQKGLTHAKFVAGFSAEGAMAYNHELFGEEKPGYAKNAGLQILPYEIHIMADGSKKVSASLGAFLNLNDVADSDSESWGNESKHQLFATIFDRVKVAEIIWDDHYAFNNIKSFDFKILDLGINVPLYSEGDFSDKTKGYAAGSRKNYSVVSLRANADAGLGHALVDDRGEDGGANRLASVKINAANYIDKNNNEHFVTYADDSFRNKKNAFNSNLSAGIEFKNKTEKSLIAVQANYNYQYSAYEKVGSYNTYHTYTYTKYYRVRTPLTQSSLQFKVDASRKIKDRNARVGMVVEYNQPLSMKVGGPEGYNLIPHSNQLLSGKLYLKF